MSAKGALRAVDNFMVELAEFLHARRSSVETTDPSSNQDETWPRLSLCLRNNSQQQDLRYNPHTDWVGLIDEGETFGVPHEKPPNGTKDTQTVCADQAPSGYGAGTRRRGRTMTKAVLGIIGGSGIYDLPGLTNAQSKVIESPWGKPSGPLLTGEIDGLPIVFLSRHDKGHRLSPSDINYRANIDVLKRAGVTDLVSLSACGSFKEELPPGTFVLVDQFVDRTHKRESSFFGTGCVAHVSMAHPVSPRLRIHIAEAAQGRGHQYRARRHLCLHRGAAILDARRKPHLQESRLFGDRHDQHAGGQARARGGDLLRHRRHGDRFRLLASRPRRRHRAGHHQGADRQRGEGKASGRAACRAIFRASTSRARSAPTARSTMR